MVAPTSTCSPLTHPGLVAGVHDAYLAAGADIIETNTFTANALSQQLHGTAGRVREINIAAARIARESADACMAADPRDHASPEAR